MQFQLLHISDFHFKQNDVIDQSIVTESLLKRIERDKEKGINPEIVIVSGDIAFSGKKEEYDLAEDFFEKLIKHTGINREKLFIVPGNHDVNRRCYRKSDIPVYSSMRDLNEEISNEDFRKDLLKGMSEYYAFVEKYMPHLKHTHNGLVPFADNYKCDAGKNINIIGLNSAWMSRSDTDERRIAIGEFQVRSALKSLPEYDVRIFLFHHPINFLWGDDAKILKSYVNNSILLTGHLHNVDASYHHDAMGKIFQFQAGASCLGTDSLIKQRFHYLTIDFFQQKIMLDFRSFSPANRKWVIDTSTGDDGKIEFDTVDTEIIGESPKKIIAVETSFTQRRRDVLDDHDYEILIKIIDLVSDLWKLHDGPSWQGFHNETHNLQVEIALYNLLPVEYNESFTKKEWFYLLASVWLHDIGMVVGLQSEDINDDEWNAKVYKLHHLRSYKYIIEHHDNLLLNHSEASTIATLCKYHRKTENIFECDNYANVRVRLIAAYLRLSIATHVDDIDSLTPEEYNALLYETGLPWKNKMHWLKSKWIKKITPQPEDLSILINIFNISSTTAATFIPETLKNNLREDLSTVKEILIRGRLSFFLDIKTNTIDDFQSQPVLEFELIRSNILLEELSSASEAFHIILRTSLRIVKISNSGLDILQDYLKEVKRIILARPCHTLIRTFINNLEEILNSDDQDKAVVIENKINKLMEKRRKNLIALSENAKTFISDGGSILLFGYSSLIINALDSCASEQKRNTHIYICECRGKTQYNYANEIVYSDGLHYAQKVREIGFQNVWIIPDISISNLMDRGLIQKVLFGTNGINNVDQSFGHTCGHLTVSDVANKYRVPVFIIADTGKIGDIVYDKDLNRDIEWFTQDRKCLEKFETLSIKKMNPREDKVDNNQVDMIITEIGSFKPDRIKTLRIKDPL
ncbi:MAG: metallophosphoesterase [Proteobacteria bacterium]|nr:metallophosphoesterase [Pseudomonadota bacterium]MBU1585735.1 metallophosphoesterase [Pseudomonadota bacterium]MBU2629940.1 metallophosphoesterase [Pseudomonadota bacterium]